MKVKYYMFRQPLPKNNQTLEGERVRTGPALLSFYALLLF